MMRHDTVLLHEAVAALKVEPGGIYVDCTLGGGGHSLEIARLLKGKGRLIAIDQDDYALSRGRERLEDFGNITFVKGNFRNLREILASLEIAGIQGVMADLGVSSFQLDDGMRGFSYRTDAPLDMRMDQTQGITAREILSTWSQDELERIFRIYGEERNARRFAAGICRQRLIDAIETTGDLTEVLRNQLTEKEKRQPGHPGRKVFQALRIAVNKELEALEELLPAMEESLMPGGRMVLISFHSLEDRLVKEFIRSKENPCTCPPDFPHCICGKVPTLKAMTRKPVLPSEDELEANPRSRSAKLRAAERL